MMIFSKREQFVVVFLIISFASACAINYLKNLRDSQPNHEWQYSQEQVLEEFKSAAVANTEETSVESHGFKNDNPAHLKRKIIGKININEASIEELQTLPRIGPVLAQRIIDYREQNGSFRSIEVIMRVKGIGKKTFEKIKGRIQVREIFSE